MLVEAGSFYEMSRRLEYDLEKLCDSFVDVSHKAFPRKDYPMRIS